MNISISAEPIFHVGQFAITNSALFTVLVMGIVSGAVYALSRSLTLIPSRVQNAVELAIELLYELFESVMGDRAQTRKFFPFIATFFFFILSVNWLGLLPGISTIGIKELHEGKEIIIPLLRSSSADLNFTFALAIISMVAVQMVGIKSLGLSRYFSKFIDLKKPLTWPVGALELVLEPFKIISLSFRLFGNIFAGEVLLAVIFFLIQLFFPFPLDSAAAFLAPLPFLMLEFFVGFIQALMFALLTLIFMKTAMEEPHH